MLQHPQTVGKPSLVSSDGSANDYLAVLQTCNNLIFNLGKNLWSKYFPEERTDNGKVELHFNIEPGDSTPRRVMVCLAKQVHNLKCVAKILERVKEAERLLESLDSDDEDEEGNGDGGQKNVDLSRLTTLSSQLTVLAKCEAAMQRRHSVRHRVLPVQPGAVTCRALCDIDCALLGIRLSQLDTYTLQDTSNRQIWVVEDSVTGMRQRVPPLFLAVEPEAGGELTRIGRARAGLERAADKMVAGLAGQLMKRLGSLRAGQADLRELQQFAHDQLAFNMLLQRLQTLEKLLSGLALPGRAWQQLDGKACEALRETVDAVLEGTQLTPANRSSSLASLLIKMQNELRVLRTFIHAQQATANLHGGISAAGLQKDALGGSRRSFRSGRSHPLSAPHRRTSVFEFEFEFLENTNYSNKAVKHK